MPKENGRRNRRIRNLVIVSSFTAIIFIVATFAWFIGMRSVSVSSFDVEIASTDSLMLSLNGSSWSNTVSISEATYKTSSYSDNTNSWGGRGLIPVSTIGEMDTSVSRLKLYEKASLTPSPGGYRLLASRVPNTGDNEVEGYVAFDLFIHNFSGRQYVKAENVLDEEAIYLTVDSKVTVAEAGVKNTGIENSVRVAFAQIGRVEATQDNTQNTGNVNNTISCTTGDVVTGLCRKAQIWEPNDTAHEKNAISWYNTSCLSRTGATITSTDSYSGSCKPVIDGIANLTYAVKKDIQSSDQVDIYDGEEYNGYTGSSAFLESYPYFTDTMKFLTGTQRPQFMTLAPNSITKVRIYIFIEGQDIDNYDFASIGKRISIQFGFTKERLTEDDINYSGPDLNQGEGPSAEDLTAPVIKLIGSSTITMATTTDAFVDPGATATDNVDQTVTVVASGKVDPSNPGTYKITYTATDSSGNVGSKTRTVIVTSPTTETTEP